MPLFGERKPFPFVQGQIDARHAQFSPDGRVIAYTSHETGQDEVYVQAFPEARGKWQISTDGGAEPAWRHDGKELFYTTQRKLMVVEVKTDGNSFQAGIPKPLFQIPLVTAAGRNLYVVTRDGQRLLFNASAELGQSPVIDVVVNWPAGLRK